LHHAFRSLLPLKAADIWNQEGKISNHLRFEDDIVVLANPWETTTVESADQELIISVRELAPGLHSLGAIRGAFGAELPDLPRVTAI
jgi:hypothetical protein